MAETVEVYGREFEIGKPKAHHYLNLLRFLKEFPFLKELIQSVDEGMLDEDTELEERGMEFFFQIIDALDESHLTHFAAVLLQGEIDETVALIQENGGVELGWLMESFAINCELVDIAQVMKSFRRASAALQRWRPAGGPEAE